MSHETLEILIVSNGSYFGWAKQFIGLWNHIKTTTHVYHPVKKSQKKNNRDEKFDQNWLSHQTYTKCSLKMWRPNGGLQKEKHNVLRMILVYKGICFSNFWKLFFCMLYCDFAEFVCWPTLCSEWYWPKVWSDWSIRSHIVSRNGYMFWLRIRLCKH